MDKSPKVSICIPNYNYAKYIEQAIDSALNQTYKNLEIIVVDNASTDNSIEVLKKYKNITVYQNDKNVGIADNHNIAANYANGEYFCLLSSDDILKPEFIEKTLNLFLKSEASESFKSSKYDLGIVMAEKDTIDENGKITQFPAFYAEDFVCKGESHAKVCMMGNPNPPSFCLVKKTAFLKTEGFKKIYGTAHDWGFLFDINMVSDVGYIHEKLGLYRVHNNISMSSILNFKYVCNIHTLKVDMAERVKDNEYLSQFIDESLKKTSSQALKFGRECLKTRNFEEAKKYMSLAVLFDEKMSDNIVYKAVLNALDSEDPVVTFTTMENEVLAVKPRTEAYPFPKEAQVVQ